MNIKKIQIVTILFLLSSCYSKMKITVDTFDKRALINSVDYTEARIKNLENVLNQKIHSLDKNYLTLSDELIKTVTQNQQVSLNGQLQNSIKSELNKLKNEPYTYYTKAIDTLNINLNVVKDSKFISYMESLESLGDKAYRDGINDLIQKLKELGITDVNVSKDLITKSFWNPSFSSQSSFGESIYSDQFSYLITRAPNKYWRKYKTNVNLNSSADRDMGKLKARYNKAKACTFFGNSDIAIKMDNPGTFTVKGVRMDANESIKTSFKVLNQGIKYLGYSAGVPINGSSILGMETNENSEMFTSLSYIESMRTELLRESERTENISKAFLISIIENGKSLENLNLNEEQRKTIINNIKILQTLYEKQLIK
ncbi:hypothetical protein [Mongoliitalea daihaiensis]|uniref:hypothetical protein n=1 Tax=Mongoliitalea daihaiensis TaxID=2782006 RepID=UPI001F1B1136|nr:hypothetical protein [Mongoliitalea daihaiensis]UJP63826.1 hypothetical protein IPZ59_13430 [Mongoliitalea daihaiensis]